MSETPRKLGQVQQWMQAVIMHPDGVVGGIESTAAQTHIDVSVNDIEQVIKRSQAQNSIERLQVYGNAYFARLVEVLRDEFPALQHAIGEEAFDGFAFGYLQAYPSHSYTLADLSRNFSQYLRETRPPADAEEEGPDWIEFLIDLAALERTYSEVFSGPGPEAGDHLKPGELQEIPPERWADATLIPMPCLRLMKFGFPVHEYATAVRQGGDPHPPDPQETNLVIGRRDFVVRRKAVGRVELEMLSAIVDGLALGDAIQRVLEQTDVEFEALAAEIGEWFKTWAAAQFFRAVEVGGADVS
ncbi:MAG: DUF2063 domain-containing protein [Planctomycetaceae bacterium]|nr:DUF2063 domain-containing protein [Planctomycetaceae bacterium]